MRFQTTETFDKLFQKLSQKIQLKAAKKSDLFKNNPFHPSLRVEKLHPKKFNVWSFRIDKDHRIVFKFVEKNLVEFMFVGHHNDIYDYSFFK